MPQPKGKTGNPNGRPKGAKNKVNLELRESIGEFLNGEFAKLKRDFRLLSPRDRMKFFSDLLPYAVPRLQNTSLEMDFEQFSDTQLDEIIQRIKTESLNQQNEYLECR